MAALSAVAQTRLPKVVCDSVGASMSRILSGELRGVTTRVTSSSVKGRRVTVNLSESMSWYPFREDNIASIYDTVRTVLPSNLRDAKIEIYAGGRRIEELVPQYYSSGRRDARFAYAKPQPPLVSRAEPLWSPRHGLSGRHIALWASHGLYFDSKDAVWKWQRSPIWTTCEDLLSRELVLHYLVPMLENAGAYVLLPHERDAGLAEMIADNDGDGYTEISGDEKWSAGGIGFARLREIYTDENPFSEGTVRSVRTVAGGRESRAEWQAEIPETNDYAVYVSYSTTDKSADDAQYTVFHAGGRTQFRVNQTMGGGTWVYLGTFRLNKGRNTVVSLSNISRTGGRVVTADAVKIGGGEGNVARAVCSSMRKPGVDYSPETSGFARYAEGARYWLQWAGFDPEIYSMFKGEDDYKDDYTSRAHWVNALAGGSERLRGSSGLKIPVDVAFALHTDAGLRDGETVGTLGIYSTSETRGRFEGKIDRMRSRDLTDIVMTQVTGDIRRSFGLDWTRRGMWDKRYYEPRIPMVPAMILELLSHQNYADMKLALDPAFRFVVCRAVYKGLLRYISSQYGVPYVVQPLPPERFSAAFCDGEAVRLAWSPRHDPSEPTAKPDGYIVYVREGDGDFDGGRLVNGTECRVELKRGVKYDFCVTAVNGGGESFRSETLSAALAENERGRLVVVNGFDRVSAPRFEMCDSAAMFCAGADAGVPYIYDRAFGGEQYECRLSQKGASPERTQLGASYMNCAATKVAGNTFDYPSRHGEAALRAGYSFCSASRAAVECGDVRLGDYPAADLVLGKQRKDEACGGRVQFSLFGADMRRVVEEYLAGGGSLLVSGCHVLSGGDDEDRAFAERVLRCRLAVSPAARSGKVRGVPSEAALSRAVLTYPVSGDEHCYGQESTDSPAPVGGAFVSMRYAENNLPAAVAAVGASRSVVLGFAPEMSENDGVFCKLIESILEFLINKKQ